MKRFLKATIFFGTALFLFNLLRTGAIFFYINERFMPLTWLAVVGFLLVGAGILLSKEEDHNHDHAHHDHDHAHLSGWGVFIVLLPILFGLLFPSRPLGAKALEKREFNVTGLSSRPARDLNAGNRTILDWVYAFQTNPDPTAFNGETIEAIGFVYRDDQFTEEQFMVGRFTLSCCVADASPVGLIVQWADSIALPLDSWVEVKGTLQAGQFANTSLPLLIAESVTPTNQPRQPYLYP